RPSAACGNTPTRGRSRPCGSCMGTMMPGWSVSSPWSVVRCRRPRGHGQRTTDNRLLTLRVLDTFPNFGSHERSPADKLPGEPWPPARRKNSRGNVAQPRALTACTDEELLARFTRGQREAFEVLVW